MEKLVRLLDDFNRDLSPYAGEAKYTIWDDSVELAKYLIDNDIKPVVHGRWIKRPSNSNQVYCSECAMILDGIAAGFYFCPNCGAKMDLEEN